MKYKQVGMNACTSIHPCIHRSIPTLPSFGTGEAAAPVLFVSSSRLHGRREHPWLLPVPPPVCDDEHMSMYIMSTSLAVVYVLYE